jgi:hypothetical protein
MLVQDGYMNFLGWLNIVCYFIVDQQYRDCGDAVTMYNGTTKAN